MVRFFVTWLVLGVVALLITYAVGLGVFRHVDFTFTQFAILLVAPAAQAAALTWPSGIRARASSALATARRHPFVMPVLVLEVLLLSAGVAFWSSSALGFGAQVSAQTTWIGVKAVAGAALCLVALTGVPPAARALIAVVLLLTAGQALVTLLERTYVILDHRAMMVPEVFLRLLFYGSLYGSGAGALLRASRAFNDNARFWMSLAIALSVPGLLIVLLSMFHSPSVMPPWRGLALMCASVSATALLLSVLTQAAGARSRP